MDLVITRVIVRGYRCFAALDVEPHRGMNLVCGGNEAGESTLLEAIALALTGRINGRWAREELNPFWFTRSTVSAFFAGRGRGDAVSPPEILIELYLTEDADELQVLRGVHNSRGDDAPGVRMRIAPAGDFAAEFAAYLANDPPSILPVEFYDVEWRGFSDEPLSRRPKALATSFIDSRTIRSSSGVDHHTREMLSEHLDVTERAGLSLAHRASKQQVTDGPLAAINSRITAQNAHLHDNAIGLQMDQSSRTSWETGVVPHVDDIPFAMAGQGQQAAIKVALAMSRTQGTHTYVLIEEPENHLAHTSLTRLIARIEAIADDSQQVFAATHSSYVANRLGLDRLLLLHAGTVTKLSTLPADTAAYFRKLATYDTLRIVLADKLALVEGPSDAMIFERAFRDAQHQTPAALGVDVVSMDGLSARRALELCAALERDAVVIQDNDGRDPDDVRAPVADLLIPTRREMLVSDPAAGTTLEPQLIAVNDETLLRRVLGVRDHADLATWMRNNKTEGALRILEHAEAVTYPEYMRRAVDLIT